MFELIARELPAGGLHNPVEALGRSAERAKADVIDSSQIHAGDPGYGFVDPVIDVVTGHEGSVVVHAEPGHAHALIGAYWPSASRVSRCRRARKRSRFRAAAPIPESAEMNLLRPGGWTGPRPNIEGLPGWGILQVCAGWPASTAGSAISFRRPNARAESRGCGWVADRVRP